MQGDAAIPPGFCQCGCGRPTSIAKQTNVARGLVKGQPRRFVVGHNRRSSGVEYVEQDCGYETPCWVWQLHRLESGHGRSWDGEKKVLAHRLYYEREKGPIPDGLDLDHLCENPPCVRPSHMEPVTNTVNVQRGRVAKLTPEDVAEIRASDERLVVLAERFGVTPATVRSVRNGMSWKPPVPPPRLNSFAVDLEIARAQMRAAA